MNDGRTRDSPDPEDELGGEMTLVEHLVELRSRLLRVIAAVLVLLLALAPFANRLYTLLATPLLHQLPKGTTMIATEVASPFFAPFKLTLVVAILLAMPFALHQLWAFIAPGLYKHERRLVMPLLCTSSVLFYAGVAFAYFVVFPLVFAFFTRTAPEGVAIMTDINHFLDFALTMFFAFGLAFEVPIAIILLVWAGLVTPKQLREKRPYVIVGVFVIGAMLTPPDVVSQTLLAVPMWLLFELGVLFSRIYVVGRTPGRSGHVAGV